MGNMNIKNLSITIANLPVFIKLIDKCLNPEGLPLGELKCLTCDSNVLLTLIDKFNCLIDEVIRLENNNNIDLSEYRKNMSKRTQLVTTEQIAIDYDAFTKVGNKNTCLFDLKEHTDKMKKRSSPVSIERIREDFQSSLCGMKREPNLNKFKKRLIERKIKIRNATVAGLLVSKKVNWVFFPHDIQLKTLIDFLNHRQFYLNKNVKKDESRFKKILSLKPVIIYCGQNEFKGYLAFIFPNNIAVLESSILNNAIYIFSNNWEQLVKLSKSDLNQNHISERIRLIHTDNWFENLKLKMKLLGV